MTLNQIIEGDCLTVLKTMPDKLVQCVVTSPPYWGLRDYGTAEWKGEDPMGIQCDHIEKNARNDAGNEFRPGRAEPRKIQFKGRCLKCGAIRIDNQLGLESTPEEYVAKMVEIFAEVQRVLRDDGTLWLNLGDAYSGGGRGGDPKHLKGDNSAEATMESYKGIPAKNLLGMPWKVAFALQADGWYLRSDIIWSKPNPMPESVTDRPTKAHEYLFLLTKKARYYYDADAIREAHVRLWDESNKGSFANPTNEALKHGSGFCHHGDYPLPNPSGRNRRTVWEIATQPYPEAHFATFPEKLVEPCILAGSSDRACSICGAAWMRETEIVGKVRVSWGVDRKARVIGTPGEPAYKNITKTVGFNPTCSYDDHEVEVDDNSRSIILDPFMGSGTVALVALKHGRDYIGIELKQDYIAMAMKRLKPLGNRPLPQQEVLI